MENRKKREDKEFDEFCSFWKSVKLREELLTQRLMYIIESLYEPHYLILDTDIKETENES